MITAEQTKVVPLVEHRSKKLPVYDAPFRPLPSRPPIGLKLAIFGAFMVSLVALAGAALLSRALTQEQQESAALEASRIQLQDQLDSVKSENILMNSQIDRLREQLKTYSVENAKIKKELDERYIDISNNRKKIRMLEERNMKLEQQLAQSRFEDEPLETVPAPAAVMMSKGYF